MVGTIMLSSRCRIGSPRSSARDSVRIGCKKHEGPENILKNTGKALPGGGGYLLPNPVFLEAGYLYGPGRLGFATTKRLKHKTRQTKLVLYDAADPPVYLGIGEEDEAEISIDLSEGTIYEVVAEPVDEPVEASALDLKLLGSSSIAGMLPAAEGEPESVDETDSEADNQTENFFVGGQSSPRRTLGISFTCNKCGARNVRTVNPLAWHSGTVFLQCAKCKVHHKVVDHLNLVDDSNLKTDFGSNVVDMKQEIARLDRLAVTRSLMPDRMRPIEPPPAETD